jgi:tRNA modification GTPase
VFSDTIAAISTPMGGSGGMGVVRISGPCAPKVIHTIFKPSKPGKLITHTIRHGWIHEGAADIDEVMVSFMARPNSYTGDDVIEISGHGGQETLKHILKLTVKAGARLAERGEFTKRALMNGKLDLSQAEAVIDLIGAKTRHAAVAAVSHLKGALSSRILSLRGKLIEFLAEIEASIDFPDEIPGVRNRNTLKVIHNAIVDIDLLLSTADLGRIFREGIKIAIIGKPNVGKSSLLNALLRQERAIVHGEPGTTRDTIEETVNIGGIAAVIVDTAGIREGGAGKVESFGIQKAIRTLEESDLLLIVLDSSRKLTSADRDIFKRAQGAKIILVLNKSDKKPAFRNRELNSFNAGKFRTVEISALLHEGIENLEKEIFKNVIGNKTVAQNIDVMINLRQRQCLDKAREALVNARGSSGNNVNADCLAIDIRSAIASLGEVTGDAVSDEIIDTIFERFCVGK